MRWAEGAAALHGMGFSGGMAATTALGDRWAEGTEPHAGKRQLPNLSAHSLVVAADSAVNVCPARLSSPSIAVLPLAVQAVPGDLDEWPGLELRGGQL